MRIARVFPTRTTATPDDALAFTDAPGLFVPEVDEVHVSVAFKWDIPRAEWLAKQWAHVAPVKMGGPAMGDRGGNFVPGMYLKPGYVITSRGCPNNCWFCDVPKREGAIRELPIVDGSNLLDSNILACSRQHVTNTLTVLNRQPEQAQFTGGLEAKRLERWSAEAIRAIHPKQLFMAYDTPDDWEPLADAVSLLWRVGFTPSSHAVRVYVLCGWPKDTMEAAEARMIQVCSLGAFPMAMLWRNRAGQKDPSWRTFQRRWARPHIVAGALSITGPLHGDPPEGRHEPDRSRAYPECRDQLETRTEETQGRIDLNGASLIHAIEGKVLEGSPKNGMGPTRT